MSKYRSAVNARDRHISTLRGACGVLMVLLMIALAGWMLSPRNLTVHNPPDLRSGSTRAWWEVHPSTVYSFAFYIFQQLNSWPKDGNTDYPYAAQRLYAPLRTIEALPGVHAISHGLSSNITSLLPSEPVTVRPLAAWGVQGVNVVALKLTNQRSGKVVLDGRSVRSDAVCRFIRIRAGTAG